MKRLKEIRDVWRWVLAKSRGGGSYNNINIIRLAKSCFSFCQNEALIKEGADFKKDPRYSYYLTIRKLLCVKKVVGPYKCVRIGGHNDGAYVMLDSLEGNIAYSIGIGDNVNWDIDMASRGYEIFQYDHTINNLPCQNAHFHWKKVGVTGGRESENMKHLSTLIRQNKHENIKGMILKMDIEGDEWQVLKTIKTDILRQFDQIVLEIHDLTLRMDLPVEEALNKLTENHQLVHIHANNAAKVDYCGDLFMPDIIELTLVNSGKYTFEDSQQWFPVANLDEPNIRDLIEIQLGIWNKQS